MAMWNLEAIAAALGAPPRQRKRDVYGLELTHPKVGTRLKLDLAPSVNALRLWCDTSIDGHLTVLGRVDLFAISNVRSDSEAHRVVFVTGERAAPRLEVSSDSTFLVTVGGFALPIVTAERGDNLIQLVGRLARPHYSEASGRPFFTAGLAEHPDGAVAPVWHNLKDFGAVARAARQLGPGEWVRLTGKPHQERYTKNWQELARPVVLLVHIETAE